MRLHIPDDKLFAVEYALRSHGETKLADDIANQVRDFKDPAEVAYREEAKNHQKDGEIEFDEDALVSISTNGAYVMGWYWIDEEDIGIEAEEIDA